MNRKLLGLVGALALAAASLFAWAATSGTNRTQQALFELFCDACGLPQNTNIRDVIASTVTLSDTQAVTGAKTFTSSITVDGGGGKTASLSHNGVAAAFDTAAASGPIEIGPANATSVILGFTTYATGVHLRTLQATVPTCSSNCGTSPSVTGTDTAGVITMGSGGSPASGFVLTFNSTWPGSTPPSCVVQSALASMVVGKMPIAVVTASTTMTVTTNGTAPANSDKYQYVCVGVT